MRSYPVVVVSLCLPDADREVTFYDTVEDPDELDDLSDDNLDPEVKVRLSEFRTKLTDVYRRRAQIRNKKVNASFAS